MTTAPVRERSTPDFPIGFPEFVTLMAVTMSLHALGIDMMLPALPAIGEALGTTEPNQQQWVVSVYMIGFGASQIVYGPIADRYGRRTLLLVSLLMFAITSVLASVATTFPMLLLTRLLQGMAGSAGRVLVVSIVRDRYVGRQMARVMSLTMMIFLMGPLLAPAIGQTILMFGPWNAIFLALAGYALMVMVWAMVRLPETLDPANRRSISPSVILSGFGMVLGNRYSLGYTLASTMTFGALLGFVSSSQQIFADALDSPDFFAIGFALSSASLALSALLNSRIVEQFGSRRVSHGALFGMIAIAAVHALWTRMIGETLTSFVILQCSTMFFIGLIGSNFNAMAMEPMGAIAGTASSLQGSITTLGAAVVSMAIGQRFDGTVTPVIEGFLACGIAALLIALVTERGRLFRPHHEA